MLLIMQKNDELWSFVSLPLRRSTLQETTPYLEGHGLSLLALRAVLCVILHIIRHALLGKCMVLSGPLSRDMLRCYLAVMPLVARYHSRELSTPPNKAQHHRSQIHYRLFSLRGPEFLTLNPDAHKNRIGSPPPKTTKYPRPPKTRKFFWGMEILSCRRAQARIKLVQPFPAPEWRANNLTDTGIFLNFGFC